MIAYQCVKVKEALAVDIQVGDVLQMKKTHPCGGREWLVLRVGMDFHLRCLTCGREMMILRGKAEKSVKKILPRADGEESNRGTSL